MRDEVKIPSYLVLASETRDFLDRCLQKNPENRATIKELANHPFFKRFQEKNDKKSTTDAWLLSIVLLSSMAYIIVL